MIRYRFLAITTAVATAAALATTLAGPAGAAPAATASSGAGYSVKATASSVTIKGAFTVPAVTGCNSKVKGGYLIAIGVYPSSRSMDVTGGLIVACHGTQPVYSAAAYVDSGRKPLAGEVRAGDTLAVVATESTKGATVKMTDEQSKTSVKATGAGAVPKKALAEMGVVESTFPSFEEVAFSGVTVNGKCLSAAHAKKLYQVVKVKGKVELLITASRLSQAGKSFSDTPAN